MAKTITLKFGADGSIIQAESSAANIRQGDSNGEVSVIASFAGKRNDEYVAKFYFERPDGKKQNNILMSPSSSQSSDFVYSIGSAWFFAVAGTAKITVRLTDFDGALSAQGSFSFNVEATQIDVEDSTITYDEAAEIEGLIAQISASAVKRAVQVTLGSNANASDFYAACIAYYEGNPKDGDRFTASTTGTTAAIVRKYAGQFMGNDKMLIIEKQTASLGPGSSVVRQNAYLVTGSSNNPTVTKIGNQDSIDELFSFFDENGNANSAVADSQGNVIHSTYATDASVVHNTGAETIAGNKTFSGETRFNGVINATHIYPTSGAPKFLGFEDKKWEAVHTKSLYLQYGVIDYGVYKVRFRGQNGYLAFESYVDDAEAAAKAYADSEIGKLLGGDYVAKKASHDDAGNEIKTYYVAHSDVVNSLISTSTVDPLSAYQGKLLKDAIDNINAILASDDDTLDEIQEIVTYIKSNKSLIDAITIEKISYSDIVDDLVSELSGKPLSAKQGYILKGLIDALSSSKVSVLDIIDNLTSSAESAKPLSARQGYVLKGLIDALDAQLNLSLINVTSIADEYNSALTYSKGDFAVHSLALYRANQDIDTPEEWTSSHWDQVNIVTLIKEKLSKGDYDSSTGVGFADNADNLVATKGLTVNDDPMSYGIVGGAQKSAVGDGNANLNKLVCVDVVKNQVYNPTWSNMKFGVSLSAANGVVSISGTSNEVGNGPVFNWTGFTPFPIGTRYIVLKDFDLPEGDVVFDQYNQSGVTDIFNKVWTLSVSFIVPQLYVSSVGVTYDISNKHIFIINLTKRYGSNDVVDAIVGSGTPEQKFARLIAFDPEILNDIDYDAGTLVSSKTAKLLSVGVNQWDEELEAGVYSYSDGTKVAGPSGYMRSANFIKVMPNTTYYRGINYWADGNILFYDRDKNFISIEGSGSAGTFTTPANCFYITFYLNYGTTYNHDICINVSDANINGKYYPFKRNIIDLPNYEGHGILKVVDGKVVADGTELYPDGNSKKRYLITDLSTLNWTSVDGLTNTYFSSNITNKAIKIGGISSSKYMYEEVPVASMGENTIRGDESQAIVYVKTSGGTPTGYLVYELAEEEDIATSVFQSIFPVEHGGTLQFLDENDNPIVGLQGSEIFYQKNLKAFTEAMGEAVGWDPERIKRLGNLSFTPEYVDITLNPSPTGAYARAQVYNATFTIVISAALSGTAGGSITFQDSEVDLTNFQTKPAEAIYDMDGKKVSEEPTTADCNIASFVGRSKNGIVLWSLLHSGVNKVKIHIEEAVPLDPSGNGKIDCRASLIL